MPEESYVVESVVLPRRKNEKSVAYDSALKECIGKGKGTYKVTIKGKKESTVYLSLVKRVKVLNNTKGRKGDPINLKVHLIAHAVYVEVK